MKTAAIIAEYNPFHNGHRYQIEQTRRETGADFILVVMSGDFVQRGAPALTDKYRRTRMALLGGADVVLELPTLYALSSAEYFAQGAVSLLDRLHVVDILSFGSESGNVALFEQCARFLVENEAEISRLTQGELKKGLSFPAARAKAVSLAVAKAVDQVFAGLSDFPGIPDSLFSSPNNILGLEYCKALYTCQSGIRPFTLEREGRGYHDLSLELPGKELITQESENLPFASATALRKALSEDPEACHKHMPETAFALLINQNPPFVPVTQEHFSGLLHYKLLTEREAGFDEYLDCTPSLSHRICKNLPQFTGFSDFCDLLKSKEVTHTRISRVLMHILLNIKTPEAFKTPVPQRLLPAPCARLLGFRGSATPLLSSIRKNSAIPLISKLADARFLLDEDAFCMLKQDIYCADIYEMARPKRKGDIIRNEWRQSPIVYHEL